MVVLHRQHRRRRRPPLSASSSPSSGAVSRRVPPGRTRARPHQVYFAHLAITDVGRGRHAAAERFARGADGLAGATGEPFAVWLENWRAQARNADGSPVRLVASDAETGLSLDLELDATKPLVAHGDRGLSPKSDEPGNASYYVGYTRLAARGRLDPGAASTSPAVEVSGEAWFDHEWSTSALGANAVGWDWFSLQLDDGRELMLFQIRREDGSTEPPRAGRSSTATAEPAVWSARTCRSTSSTTGRARRAAPATPRDGACRCPPQDLDLLVEPWLEAQEMRTSFVYWEGAVRSRDRLAPAVTGRGYVELTGYARSMQGVF